MSEEKNSNMFSNAKLSTIFLVVLGLHVIVIVLISAYHLLRGETSVDMAERVPVEAAGSYESMLSGGTDRSSPEVVTAHPESVADSGTELSEGIEVPMSMPPADDPIWTGQAPVTSPGVQGVTETVERVEEAATFRPAPVAPVKRVVENAAEVSRGSATEYTVQRGDTLSALSARYQVPVSTIQQANQLSSSMIRVGQKLIIPGAVASSGAMAKAAGADAPAPKRAVSVAPVSVPPKATVVHSSTYTVSKGDTLWKISRRFSTTPQQLVKMNGMSDPSKLRVGDVLKVPGNVSRSASAREVETSTDMAMIPGR